MLFGGSRSGKTFWLCRAVATRALKAAGSRHLIARFRHNHVMQSIWRDTWPKMLRVCYPDLVGKLELNKSDGVQILPNGSEVWFGGLDDDARVEKVLGNEYATIYANECSQIGLSAIDILKTRLAQNVRYLDASGAEIPLKLKFYYDCNPPSRVHWTFRTFVEHKQAEPPYKPLADPADYICLQMNPADNAANLPPQYLTALQNLPARQKLRFFDGNFGGAAENALWTAEGIEKHRVKSHPDLQRIIVAVDPSGASGKEDERSDHIGINVSGLGVDGHGYVLEDLTVRAGPAVWGKVAVQAAIRHGADAIVGEINYGGAMVEHVIKTAAKDLGVTISYLEVTATRGKVVRAEPVSAAAELGTIHHVGAQPELEDELCAMTTAGYIGDRSPNRADAYVWAIAALFPGLLRGKMANVDWNKPDLSSLPSFAQIFSQGGASPGGGAGGGWMRG